MDHNVQMLFDYLHNLIYQPSDASLNLEALDADYLMLGKGLIYLGECVNETRSLAMALSKGDLSVSLPPVGNELAAPLKALHASLKHLTWQAQQIAKGDYRQCVDFMGEFSEAFNRMTAQLESRTQSLEREIKESREKTAALEQSNSLLATITSNMPQPIIVLKTGAREILFTNRAAQAVLTADPSLVDSLLEAENRPDGQTSCEFVQSLGGGKKYYSLTHYHIMWKDMSASAFTLSEISDSKREIEKLEAYAYQDTLTGLYNRFYGMQALRRMLGEQEQFALCFLDLDNLKYVNDHYGHAEGDLYIIAAARHLTFFSPGAVVSRVGGDEFFVLAPGFTAEKAETRMKEICLALREEIRKDRKPYHVNMSYGVVEVRPDTEMSASQLLSLADERMYENKRKNKEKWLRKEK